MSGAARNLDPAVAGRILDADFQNIVKKVAAGKPLTVAEWARIEARAAGSTETTAYAKTKVELAELLGVIGIHKAGLGWEVLLKEGWVIERKPKSTGGQPAVKFWMPEFGGVTLDTVPRPRIGMSFGDFLYCRFQTDTQGEVSGTPVLVVSAADENGVHYKPDDPEESGVTGNDYVKLLKLESDGGNASDTVQIVTAFGRNYSTAHLPVMSSVHHDGQYGHRGPLNATLTIDEL